MLIKHRAKSQKLEFGFYLDILSSFPLLDGIADQKFGISMYLNFYRRYLNLSKLLVYISKENFV